MEYLTALNKIFEKTLLRTTSCIFDADGTAMQRLDRVFCYFTEWADELVKSGV